MKTRKCIQLFYGYIGGVSYQLDLLERNNTYSMRGICMILILAHHIYQHAFVNVPTSIALVMYSIGWLATGMFFFLSGYGMFFSLRKNPHVGIVYAKDKLLKLVKPFLFGFVVFLVYDLIAGTFDYSYYAKCLFTLTMPTTISWFLKVIFLVYVLTFIVFATKMQEDDKLKIITAVIIIYFCVANFCLDSFWYESILNFPLGLYFAKYKEPLSQMPKRTWLWLLLAFLLSFYVFKVSSHLWFIPNMVFSLFCVYLFAVVNVSNKVLAFIGTYSLCFYLYEMHPLYWLDQIPVNRWLYALGVFVITTALTLLYIFVNEIMIPLIWDKNITHRKKTSRLL